MKRRRLALLILASAVELGAPREAAAAEFIVVWGERRIGVMDICFPTNADFDLRVPVEDYEYEEYTYLCLGQLGSYSVPFTATQGLIGFGVIMAALVVLPAVCWKRWGRAL